jgi:hypothetical protein
MSGDAIPEGAIQVRSEDIEPLRKLFSGCEFYVMPPDGSYHTGSLHILWDEKGDDTVWVEVAVLIDVKEVKGNDSYFKFIVHNVTNGYQQEYYLEEFSPNEGIIRFPAFVGSKIVLTPDF